MGKEIENCTQEVFTGWASDGTLHACSRTQSQGWVELPWLLRNVVLTWDSGRGGQWGSLGHQRLVSSSTVGTQTQLFNSKPSSLRRQNGHFDLTHWEVSTASCFAVRGKVTLCPAVKQKRKNKIRWAHPPRNGILYIAFPVRLDSCGKNQPTNPQPTNQPTQTFSPDLSNADVWRSGTTLWIQ